MQFPLTLSDLANHFVRQAALLMDPNPEADLPYSTYGQLVRH